MISERMLPKEEVAEYLHVNGYEQVDSEIDGHSLWKGPSGLFLTVPEIPPDGVTCERWLLERISELEMASRQFAN